MPHFQLPLSGSHTIAAGTLALFLIFQLPLSGSRSRYHAELDEFNHFQLPLSGSQHISALNAIGKARLYWNFNSLSRDHHNTATFINADSTAEFQLPLSGSLGVSERRVECSVGNKFQLPLSGSLLLDGYEAAYAIVRKDFNSLSRDHLTYHKLYAISL